MRTKFIVALASVAVLVACAEAHGQKKSPPCYGYKGDAAKYADCMDTMEIRGAFNVVLGRQPTAAELEKWKTLPPIKTTTHPGETRYVKLLLDWLLMPAQANERLAVADRAYNSSSPTPATIVQRTHWANAIKDQRLTYSRVRSFIAPDLTVAELKAVPEDATSIMVRIANLGQWTVSRKTEMSWNLAGDSCEYDLESRLFFPLPSIPNGKGVWVKVKSTHRLHGLVHVGYRLQINQAGDKDSDNNIKCVKPSIGTKDMPTGPPLKIVPGIKQRG